jgi:hypothetical protein
MIIAIIGAPLLFLFKRYLIKNSNIAQAVLLSVYSGALLLYIMALIPLRLFNHNTITMMLIASSSILLIGLLIEATKYKKKLGFSIVNFLKKDLVEVIITFAFFLISLTIQIMPLTRLLLGSIHDTSLHALFAQLILENGRIPETHEPYLPAAIIFVQGAHVIFAFASLILDIPTPLVVFRITPLFSALTTLAAYHFGKVVDGRRYAALSYAFIFTFVSMWPTYITWGGNTFVIGAPLFLVTASLLSQLINSRDLHAKHLLPLYIITGLFLGYLASLHLTFFLVLAIGCMIFILINHKKAPRVVSNLKYTVMPLSISITLISPFLYRYFLYSQFPGGNIGLPPDVVSSEDSLVPTTDPRLTYQTIIHFLSTLSSQYNISPYPLTRYITIGLSFLIISALVVQAFKKKRLTPTETIGSILCLASIILLFIEPINPIPTLSRRTNLTLYISIMLLWGGFNLSLIEGIKDKLSSTKKTIILVFIVLFIIYAPFVYYRVAEDPNTLYKNYKVFAVTTENDYELMLWIKNHLPQNSTILINPYEPGLFIPALSQKKIVYPLSAYQLSLSYGRVVDNLIKGLLDSEVFNYLKSMNITHIYVGSQSTPLVRMLKGIEAPSKWDPLLFLNNPNFKLIKKIGNAFLFEFSYTDPSKILMDSFEYKSIDYGGWRVGERGAGAGSATIVGQNAFEGLHSLMLLSRGEGGPYWISVYRRVYVPSSSNLTLSFYLKLQSGFGPKDALMIIISDTRWDKQLYFVTNSKVPTKYAPIHLTSSDGYFEFNISGLWEEFHGEPLPTSFFIQVLNYDADGIENVAYIDAIAISVSKSHVSTSCYTKFANTGGPLCSWKFSERRIFERNSALLLLEGEIIDE